MRLPIFSLGAGLLLAANALAQNSGGGGSSMQLPVGQIFKQFEFPVYQDGKLHYTLFAAEAKGITLNRAETSNLKIDVYENGVRTTVITSPKADLYAAEQKMRTKNTVHIDRSDMDATSQDCDFDVKAKIFLLRTRVKVVLKHFDVGHGIDKPAGAPAGQAAAPLPTPTAPLPNPDADVSMPGAVSDTNAAPLPPGGTK